MESFVRIKVNVPIACLINAKMIIFVKSAEKVGEATTAKVKSAQDTHFVKTVVTYLLI